jgi:hypothetical protein
MEEWINKVLEDKELKNFISILAKRFVEFQRLLTDEQYSCSLSLIWKDFRSSLNTEELFTGLVTGKISPGVQLPPELESFRLSELRTLQEEVSSGQTKLAAKIGALLIEPYFDLMAGFQEAFSELFSKNCDLLKSFAKESSPLTKNQVLLLTSAGHQMLQMGPITVNAMVGINAVFNVIDIDLHKRLSTFREQWNWASRSLKDDLSKVGLDNLLPIDELIIAELGFQPKS